jgi:osmotically inducible protein OsmC
MAEAKSQAHATWHGNLTDGSGKVSVNSAAFRDQPVSWSARTHRDPKSTGVTSPEELIAAAHAACLSMAFSNILNKNGTPPDELNVTSTVTFAQADGGWGISAVNLDVVGQVPNISEQDFERLADEAKQGCPVSRALKGNVDITVTARLRQ